MTGKHGTFVSAGFGTGVRIRAQVVESFTGVELVFARVATQLGQRVVDHVNHLHDPHINLAHVRSAKQALSEGWFATRARTVCTLFNTLALCTENE